MRKVYTPPPVSGGRLWPVLGALLITVGVFLVLPLTQMISGNRFEKTELTQVAVVQPPPPPPVAEPEPPPPPPDEEPPPPPPMDLQPQSQQLSLDQLDLDFGAGTGGALASLAGAMTEAATDTKQASIVDMADLDKQPELLSPVDPVYPRDMLKAKQQGSVTIQFVLNEEGQVEEPRVENATRAEFERPALEAIRKWRFRPGTRGGEAVRTYMRVPIAFRISS